jgi:hypothetical protein
MADPVAEIVPNTQPQLFESLRTGQYPWSESIRAIHFSSNPKECLPGDGNRILGITRIFTIR